MSLNFGQPPADDSGPDGAVIGAVGGNDPGGTSGEIKRGRGRPRKSAAGSGSEQPASINPADLGNDSGPGDGPAAASGSAGKRGRPRKEKEAPISIEAFIVALSAAQMSLVALTNIPECSIGQPQTTALAQGLANVARHYPVVMSQKQQDIAMLVYTMGSIGVTQYFLYSMRKSKEAEAKRRQEEMSTVDLTPNSVN